MSDLVTNHKMTYDKYNEWMPDIRHNFSQNSRTGSDSHLYKTYTAYTKPSNWA